MENQKRAVLYLRSGIGNDDAIKGQELILRKYATEKGYQVTDVYADNGYRGTDFDRPALNKLSADIEAGLVDVVLVKNKSRIGRSPADTAKWLEDCRNKGVVLESVIGDGDSDIITQPLDMS